jgi:hypothetical protein
MFTTDSVARVKVLGGMAWRQSPEEADLRRARPMCAPKHHDHDQDAHNALRATGKVRRPHRERNRRNEKVRGSSPPKSAGVRVVARPATLVDVMKRHLAEFPAEDEGLIFRGPLVLRCVATTFIDRFAGHKALRGRVFRPDSTFTIYATPATTWRRQAAPAPMAVASTVKPDAGSLPIRGICHPASRKTSRAADGALEEWHRYSLPSFTERMRTGLRNHCQEDHQSWPAKGRYTRHWSAAHAAYSAMPAAS